MVLLALLFMVGSYHTAVAQVVLKTRDLRLEIRDDGVVQSLTASPCGTEYSWVSEPAPIAMVYRGGQLSCASQKDFIENEAPAYRGGQSFPASRVSLVGDRLAIDFSTAQVKATYQVKRCRDYLAFKLLSLEGKPIDRIDLLNLKVRRLPYLGPWINVAYDDDFGICLCAGNIKTNAGMNQHKQYVEMKAIAEKRVALKGAVAVLFGIRNPKNKFLDAMEIVERDFNMPAGARHRRLPVQNYSYLWCSPTPENIDEYIKLAKRCGFRMILFSYTAFSQGVGHFPWNSQYSNGMSDLKKVTGAIRGAGLKVGLHIHYNKAVKNDPYVTPVPDDRLNKLRNFSFSTKIDSKADMITVNENPSGCTLDNGRRILKAGNELIAYQDYTTSAPFRFSGCERGYLDTTSAEHQIGEEVSLLDVDDWPIFIRFNQNTDIQDETAQRLGEIFLRTGPYDMVYFDGAEDVHRPFWYHVVNAQYCVYRHFQPEPAVCETALNTHFSWHMMSRSHAYDLSSRHIKNFCHKISCRVAPVRALDFSRIDFGWIFGLFDYFGPDVLEYIISRGAAWDCPFSIRLNLKQVKAHPRLEDCLNVIRLWEDARIENKLTDAHREMLRTLDKDEYQYIKVWDALLDKVWIDTWKNVEFTDQEHHLFVNEHGEHELVKISEIPDVAGGFFRAYSFCREARPDDTCILIWAMTGEADLLLPVAPDRLMVMKPFATRLPVEVKEGRAVVPVGGRKYLILAGMKEARARELLRKAGVSHSR